MKFINKLTPVALATAMAFGGMAVPVASQAAGLSSDATISSMYLWRGQDISASGPVLSGDLNYTDKSGLYANLWISSFGVIGGTGAGLTYSTESDWTVGYSGSAGDFGYDLNYYRFWYPESDHTGLGHASGEIVLGLTYKDAGFTVYQDATGPNTYTYMTASYGMGPFSALVGYDKEKTASDSYKHLDLSYAATDRLSFTVSKRFAPGATNTLGEDPLFMISYSLPVDLK